MLPVFRYLFQSLEYGQEKRPADFSRGLLKSLIHNDISGGVDVLRIRTQPTPIRSFTLRKLLKINRLVSRLLQ
jgi:hypothetical protein